MGTAHRNAVLNTKSGVRTRSSSTTTNWWMPATLYHAAHYANLVDFFEMYSSCQMVADAEAAQKRVRFRYPVAAQDVGALSGLSTTSLSSNGCRDSYLREVPPKRSSYCGRST